jgi:ParB family chromosome partitioning protein
MPRKSGLGKGLDALIPGGEEGPQGGPTFLPIEKICANPRQPRENIDPEGLADLVSSIREHGILQPLIVTRDEDKDEYSLIAGERRLRAAQLAGLEQVPVIVRRVSEQLQLELALIENLQRADLTPLETAEAYRQLVEDFGLQHEEVAARVGKSRAAVTNTLRLLKLPVEVQSALREGKISEGHARALLGLNSTAAQLAALKAVLDKDLSVRKTEELVRKLLGERPERPPAAAHPPEIMALEERLRARLGTRVTVRHGKKGGSVVIHYYSDEELDAIVSQILGE